MTPVAFVALIRQDGPRDFIVTFPDVPEAITQGDTLQQARMAAHDALATALAVYLDMERPFPTASQILDEHVAPGSSRWVTAVEPKLAARARLAAELKSQGISKVGLARMLGKDEKIVHRMLTGRSASLEAILEALRAVGVWPALAA